MQRDGIVASRSGRNGRSIPFGCREIERKVPGNACIRRSRERKSLNDNTIMLSGSCCSRCVNLKLDDRGERRVLQGNRFGCLAYTCVLGIHHHVVHVRGLRVIGRSLVRDAGVLRGVHRQFSRDRVSGKFESCAFGWIDGIEIRRLGFPPLYAGISRFREVVGIVLRCRVYRNLVFRLLYVALRRSHLHLVFVHPIYGETGLGLFTIDGTCVGTGKRHTKLHLVAGVCRMSVGCDFVVITAYGQQSQGQRHHLITYCFHLFV